jgi:transposase-like protein
MRGTQVDTDATSGTLHSLYVEQQFSLSAVADRLGATKHLLRTWMDHYSIPGWIVDPASGAAIAGPRSPAPPPSQEELRRLLLSEHLSVRELAEHYGVHPHTVAGWLDDYNIVCDRRGGRLQGVSVAELVDVYQSRDLTVAELARQVGLGRDQVAHELRADGVEIDSSRRPPPRRLSAEERRWAVQRYGRRRVAAAAHR